MRQTKAQAFLDTNVLLYAFSADSSKAEKAEALLARGGVVGLQVLNEFASVARRKMRLAWPEIEDVLSLVRRRCSVRPLTLQVHEQALKLASRYGFSWYDALVVAAALEASCAELLSEDLHDGLVVEGTLRIRNPFKDDMAPIPG
ncbi:PIN domain-containing protein [Azohydromonas aeria]|uniref:PIN domain-containing protein n=1 Tax=Azohydromonas aeria TaxID=2590212 RepID=UPI0012FC2D09|nr:PIN domain-containing protein [Azohydromonas aeria]